MGKVRKDGGKSGEGKAQLSTDTIKMLDKAWAEIVTDKLGSADLTEMREAWRKERTNAGML